jgi:hypothetical protein
VCRNKLSKLEWKYIIIDEAQRMKDRESKLSQVGAAMLAYCLLALYRESTRA